MRRDLERICAAEGLPLKLRPFRFPQNGLKAARLALVGERQGWTPAFTRAVFTANYAEQKDVADDARLPPFSLSLALTREPRSPRLIQPENKEALKHQTEEAASRGLFGAPSFTVGDELFWGNDRLEAALAWAKRS
jgi:2-hydroxychromene-2-carboxylate isomerase